jgi:hypothetical protein
MTGGVWPRSRIVLESGPHVLPNEAGPPWADALLSVLWAHCQYFDYKNLLVEIYPVFEKFIAWLKANGLQHIRAAAGWRANRRDSQVAAWRGILRAQC